MQKKTRKKNFEQILANKIQQDTKRDNTSELSGFVFPGVFYI